MNHYPFVRPEPTSLRPDLPIPTAPRASAVQDAAVRHRRSAPARSVLDRVSTVLMLAQVGRCSFSFSRSNLRGYRPAHFTLDYW